MELNSTFESIDALNVSSPASSQPQSQELFATATRVRRQQLTLAQMRGVIQIFKHYFPKDGKRMPKELVNRKWASYKNRIYQEYGRVIAGKLPSEKALIKRYSKPLDFLKYKLKRVTNLRIEDLSEINKEYYYEIGGIDDVEELIRRQNNIDSVQKISNNFANYNNARKRRRIDLNAAHNNANNRVNDDSNHNHNHNRFNRNNQQPEVQILNSSQNQAQNNNDDDSAMSIPPKLEKDEKMTEALTFVKDKMDFFERELLDKKKIEVFEITKQKLTAINQNVRTQLLNYPHMIGCLPNIEQQESIAFHCWLQKYKHLIVKDSAVKNKIEDFIDQIMILRLHDDDWKSFLAKWKLNRIFYNDNFNLIWAKVKNELNIEPLTSPELLTQIVNDDKEENDEEKNDEDDDI